MQFTIFKMSLDYTHITYCIQCEFQNISSAKELTRIISSIYWNKALSDRIWYDSVELQLKADTRGFRRVQLLLLENF